MVTSSTLTSQKHLFSIPKGTSYLNCGYMGPLLKSAEEVGVAALKEKSKPFNIRPKDFFEPSERLRQQYARLINCPDPKRLVLIPSVSYGMANVANNIHLEAGQEILIAAEQFPSNVYPWMELAARSGAQLVQVAPPTGVDNRGPEWNNRILEAINPKTRLIALGQVHWADGTLFDLAQIRVRSREVGALFVVDATQSVGALPFDLAQIDPDAMMVAAYKWLLGPYSIGLGYYGPYFDQGTPVEHSWMNRLDSEDFQGLVNFQEQFQPGALRFEVGEHSNFIMVPMVIESLRQILEWTPERIQNYCGQISDQVLVRIKEAGHWIESPSNRGNHLFGIRLSPDIDRKRLLANFDKHQVYVSYRGDAIRVSLHLFNDSTDLEKLVSCFNDL